MCTHYAAGEDDETAEKERVARILTSRLMPQSTPQQTQDRDGGGGGGAAAVVGDAMDGETVTQSMWNLERCVLLERVASLENESRSIAKRLLQQQAVTAQEMASLEIENESLRSYVDRLMGQVSHSLRSHLVCTKSIQERVRLRCPPEESELSRMCTHEHGSCL